MSGLAIGGALALAAALWVLAPVLRVRAASSPLTSDRAPRESAESPCTACGASPEPGAEYCAQCGRRLTS